MIRLLTQSAILATIIVTVTKIIDNLLLTIQKTNINKDWFIFISVLTLLVIILIGFVIIPNREKN